MFKIDLTKIKSIYRGLPSELLYPLLFVPFSVFCGAPYRKQYKELESISAMSNEQYSEVRNNRLINYLNDSIKYTKFYSDHARSLNIKKVVDIEQLFDFPIISKDQIQEDLEWFLDSRFENNRYKVSTGGTTGKQTQLYLSNDCYSKEWSFVNKYLHDSGVDINSKRLCLRGVTGISPSDLLGHNPLYKELLISPFKLNSKNLLANIGAVKRFDAKWLHGYPSSIKEFCSALEGVKFDVDMIEHILLVSEKIYSEQLIKIQDTFTNAKILSFYGMTERVIFAPLVGDVFVPNQLYGVTEEIDGELIGTGFVNEATRLVRYRTGDTAKVVKKNGFVTEITELTGRWGKEFLLGSSGVKITMTSLNTHCDSLERVKKYQFRQSDVGCCTMLLVVNEEFTHKDEEKLVAVFKSKVGQELKITSKIVSEIPLTARGKHQFIVSSL
jgi:phenylacetate-CoA ligase